jgi:hypothetical protein
LVSLHCHLVDVGECLLAVGDALVEVGKRLFLVEGGRFDIFLRVLVLRGFVLVPYVNLLSVLLRVGLVGR